MTDHNPVHRTLILRCWSEQDELAGQRFWRFHLHWLDSDEQQGFADVAALLVALEKVFGSEQGEIPRRTSE